MSLKAVITGAGSGIGAEVAKRLDARGFQLVLSGSNEDKLATLGSTLRNQPEIVVADLGRREELSLLCEKIRLEHTDTDVAFLNAGVVETENFADRTTEAIDRELDINLRSTLHLSHAFLPAMRQKRSGHLLATVSMGGILALADSSVYSATKFALRGFLSALRQEVIEDGVIVSGLYPGAIDTPMLRHEALCGGSSLNFLGTPLEVNDVANAFIRALETKNLEVYVPYGDSVSARFFSVFPRLLPVFLPSLKKRGEKGRREFIRRLELRSK